MVLRADDRYVTGWNGLVQPTRWTFAVDGRSTGPRRARCSAGWTLATRAWPSTPGDVHRWPWASTRNVEPPAQGGRPRRSGYATYRPGRGTTRGHLGVSRVMCPRWISGSVTPHSAHREHLLTALTLVQEAARRLGSARIGDWLLRPVASNGPRPIELFARRDYDALNAEVRLAELLTFGRIGSSYGGDPPTADAGADVTATCSRPVRERFSAAPPDATRPFAIAPTADGGVLVGVGRSPGANQRDPDWRRGRPGLPVHRGRGAAPATKRPTTFSEVALELIHRVLRGTAES